MSAVDRAKKALDGVTPGPWKWDDLEWPDALYNGDRHEVMGGRWHNDETAGINVGVADAEFITAARDLVPELITECESWQNVAATRQALIEQLKAENGRLQSEIDYLKRLPFTEKVTRVTVVKNGVITETFADKWVAVVQDHGRTIKLFGNGSGDDARAERDSALAALLATDLQRTYCNGCGSGYLGPHECLRDPR